MGFFNKLFGKNKKENETLVKEEKFEEKNKINSETENMEKTDISLEIEKNEKENLNEKKEIIYFFRIIW